MIVDNPTSLNQWLISYLEPICDADPQALAKYIMALIKKDKQQDELKKICLEQLEVFLIDETSSFVEKLFITLENKSYLDNTNHNSTNLNSNHNEQQRSRSPKSHRNVPAPSGSSRRYQQPINTITNTSNKYDARNSSNQSKHSPLSQQQNSPHKKRRERSRSLEKNFKRNRSGSPQLHHQLQENQQHFINNNKNNRRFRDYDDRNYSMRNNLCTINPNQESTIDNSLINFTNNNNNLTKILVSTSTNNQTHQQYTPEPYNPETPKIDEQQYRSTNTIDEQQNSRNGLNNSSYLKNEFNSGNNQRSFVDNDELNNYKHKINYLQQNKHNRQSNNGANVGGNKSQFRSNNKRNNKQFTNQNENLEKTTLLVCKIPPNLNTITNLNEHFSKFGTITNLKIGFDNDLESSLVEFSSNQEALAAYRSTEAVLNNRFIKVFWHSSNSSTSSKNLDKLNENETIDKSGNFEKKSSIKDRLGKINEKQASITNNAVSNLLNSGLANAPNQLASLMMIGNNSNILPTVVPKLISKPVSKPVFDPSKLKKQYQPSVTNSNNAANPISNSTTNSTSSNLETPITTSNISNTTTATTTSTAEVKTKDTIDTSNVDNVLTTEQTTVPTTVQTTTDTVANTTSNLTTATTAITSSSINTTSSNKLTKTINTTKLINKTSINKLPLQINKEKLNKKLELQKKRQGILSTLIQQNRLLIDKLEKSKTDAEKQSIRETLDTLTKQIKNLENEIKKENESIISETNLKKQQLSIS